jgi:trimethylamine--corrinoid protein Co-methyltransferase
LTKINRFKFLSEDKLEEIHAASLEVLERTGILVKNAKALELLRNEGCEIDSQVVRMPSSLVEECLKKVVSTLELHTRDGDGHFQVGGDNVVYNPGSSAVYFIDRDNWEIRRALSNDLLQLVRLVDALENIHAQSTAIVPGDVPEKVGDLYRLYVILKNSNKPVVTGAFTKEGLLDMNRMLEIVVGGSENLDRAPRAIFDACPSSPLMWSDVTCQNLIDCAELGLPAEIIPAPQMGATSPVSIIGTLIQSNAEILSGVVISQTVKSGSPIIYGGSPSAFDMRYCTARLGSIEAIIAACTGAELGKRYGLPTHAYLGLSDSKVVDAQSGFESGLGIMIGAMAGINIISGPGMLASENCQSLEKMVIDNELCGMAYRLLEGAPDEDFDSIADVIAKVGPGGHFLGERHTREKLRREQFIPTDVVCRLSLDAWRKEGARDIVQRAKSSVDRLVKDHEPKRLPSDVEKLLDQFLIDILHRYHLSDDFIKRDMI